MLVGGESGVCAEVMTKTPGRFTQKEEVSPTGQSGGWGECLGLMQMSMLLSLPCSMPYWTARSSALWLVSVEEYAGNTERNVLATRNSSLNCP